MNAIQKNAKRFSHSRGFTLLELIAVVAIVTILASIILPALFRAKSRAQGTFCLSNSRQLLVAWTMYADEHDGRLAYNLGGATASIASGSEPTDMSPNWANNVLSYDLNPDNTNALKLAATGIGPYLNRAAAVYRCPSDYVLSSKQKQAGWGSRVRSYSMNAMVGDAGNFLKGATNINNPDYVQFLKASAIPHSGNIFVFLDENPDTITDGYFVNRAYQERWLRLPASYHDGAASFAFADGHSESHHWRYALTKRSPNPDKPYVPIDIPVGQRADYYWLISRMSVEMDSGSGAY